MHATSKRVAAAVAFFVWIAAANACHSSCNRSSGAGQDGGAEGSDAIGVPECDDYLSKYRHCIDDKVPSDHKKAFEQAFERTRATWKALAKNPGTRPGLAQACTLATQTAQTSLRRYACVW